MRENDDDDDDDDEDDVVLTSHDADSSEQRKVLPEELSRSVWLSRANLFGISFAIFLGSTKFHPSHPQASNLKLFQDYRIHFRFSFIIEVILRYPISFHHAFHLVSIWGMKIGIFSQRLDLCLNSIKISLLYWLSTMGFVPL